MRNLLKNFKTVLFSFEKKVLLSFFFFLGEIDIDIEGEKEREARSLNLCGNTRWYSSEFSKKIWLEPHPGSTSLTDQTTDTLGHKVVLTRLISAA